MCRYATSLYQASQAYILLVISCITEAVFTKPNETWRSQTSFVYQGLLKLLALTLRRCAFLFWKKGLKLKYAFHRVCIKKEINVHYFSW